MMERCFPLISEQPRLARSGNATAKIHALRLFSAFGLMVLAIGCNRSPYDVAPVSGKVLLDDVPLSGGQLMFAPVAEAGSLKSGKPGFAKIESDGTFVVSTYDDYDGAVVAKHRLTLINNPESEAGKRLGVNRVMIPDVYEVKSGESNEFTVEITTSMVEELGITF